MADKEEATTAAKAAEGPRTIKWDDSSMQSSYANVCNAVSSREEVSIFFGTNQAWNPTEAELTVQLTNRVTLSPYAAKRLSLLLNNTLNEYESKFGELKLDA